MTVMKTDTASDAMPCRIWISREQKTFYFKEKKGFGKKEFASEAHMWHFVMMLARKGYAVG